MRLSPLESLLNRNIATSSAARAACKRLAGKVLALNVTGLPLRIYFACDGERLTVTTEHASATATLSGTPIALARLAGPAPESALRTGTVHIEGDAEVAQTFSELF